MILTDQTSLTSSQILQEEGLLVLDSLLGFCTRRQQIPANIRHTMGPYLLFRALYIGNFLHRTINKVDVDAPQNLPSNLQSYKIGEISNGWWQIAKD
jgi:hypothetical protein